MKFSFPKIVFPTLIKTETLIQALFWVSVVALVILLYIWSTYNAMIRKRNQVKTDFADIDVQLKRRASLIERLVDIVKEYSTHEKETFTQVAQARSHLDTSRTAGEHAKADNMLTATLRSLFSVVENYPKLQASENYQGLRQDIKDTEDNIAGYREEYNRTVQQYNNLLQTFPNVFVATLFQFTPEELFQSTDTQ